MDFLAENLDQFSEDTLSLLPFGACLGQSFSVEDLSAVSGQPEEEINRKLVLVAVGQEAVYPIEKMRKPAVSPGSSLPMTGFSRYSIQSCPRRKGCRFTIRLQNDMSKRAVLEGGYVG